MQTPRQPAEQQPAEQLPIKRQPSDRDDAKGCLAAKADKKAETAVAQRRPTNDEPPLADDSEEGNVDGDGERTERRLATGPFAAGSSRGAARDTRAPPRAGLGAEDDSLPSVATGPFAADGSGPGAARDAIVAPRAAPDAEDPGATGAPTGADPADGPREGERSSDDEVEGGHADGAHAANGPEPSGDFERASPADCEGGGGTKSSLMETDPADEPRKSERSGVDEARKGCEASEWLRVLRRSRARHLRRQKNRHAMRAFGAPTRTKLKRR